MANTAQALVKLQALERGLVAMVAEGRRRSQEPIWSVVGFGASEDERLYLRAAGVFNDFCRAMKHLAWLAQFDAEAASLYQEATAAVEGAGASSSVTWPLAFRTDWEVDYLGLEYQLRQHLPGLLDCMERLIDGLRQLLRRWADSPSAPVIPPQPAPVPAPRQLSADAPRRQLRLLASCR